MKPEDIVIPPSARGWLTRQEFIDAVGVCKEVMRAMFPLNSATVSWTQDASGMTPSILPGSLANLFPDTPGGGTPADPGADPEDPGTPPEGTPDYSVIEYTNVPTNPNEVLFSTAYDFNKAQVSFEIRRQNVFGGAPNYFIGGAWTCDGIPNAGPPDEEPPEGVDWKSPFGTTLVVDGRQDVEGIGIQPTPTTIRSIFTSPTEIATACVWYYWRFDIYRTIQITVCDDELPALATGQVAEIKIPGDRSYIGELIDSNTTSFFVDGGAERFQNTYTLIRWYRRDRFETPP